MVTAVLACSQTVSSLPAPSLPPIVDAPYRRGGLDSGMPAGPWMRGPFRKLPHSPGHLVEIGGVGVLQHRRDEATVGHGHRQRDVDIGVVGNAAAVRRAGCGKANSAGERRMPVSASAKIPTAPMRNCGWGSRDFGTHPELRKPTAP